MTYEAWRISYQSSEQAARAAYAEFDDLRTKLEATEEDRSRFLLEMGRLCAQCDALRAKLEAAEKKHDGVARQLVQSEITRREISEAHSAVTRRLSVLADENTTLRAKIAAMEQPESGFRERCTPAAPAGGSNRFPLYALPGAQGEGK